MVVGIDAGPLLGQRGISRYVTPLIRRLLTTDVSTAFELLLRRSWMDQATGSELGDLAPLSRISTPDRLLSFWWDRFDAPFPWQRTLWNRLDVYFDTCLMGPILGQGKVIALVYDLIPLRLPKLFTDHRTFRHRMERVCRRATALVAISAQTKQDLVDLLGIDPAKISVIYPGAPEAVAMPDQIRIDTVLHKHHIAGPYLLYVGALGPHKNVATLVQAYERARAVGSLEDKLVIAGWHTWGRPTLDLVARSPVKEDIILTGFVPDEELFCLYAGADLFLFPSLYEGFGLPVLEAMAYGLPVMTSNTGALPEAIGEAGISVDPHDPDAWAGNIVRIMGDADLRRTMARQSLRQAERFSWTRSADRLQGLFEQVHRGGAQ
ncbi:MAG: hypothetical protein OJF47_000414 [Nitrospira sp.]|jgi:glycosyltransferase involved in cell wall biosynthesis|nr:MAG: hypothetical protein OJF47_000414 [Nitrospira sp.]